MSDEEDISRFVQNDEELPSDEDLGTISSIATRAKQTEAQIIELTERLQQASAEYRQITEHDLPRALERANVSSFTLGDGTAVSKRLRYDAGKLTNPQGLAWVDAQGGSSLIKTVITIEMDRGDAAKAREIFQELRSHRYANSFKGATLSESVVAQTLGKFVRELVDEGKDPDLALLGVHRRTYVVVGKRPATVELKGFKR